MDLVYLDYNCFQRGFDDPGQVRIQMEALACQEIFIKADYFLTCDDRLMKQAKKLELSPALMNPVDYIRQEKN